MGCNKGIQLLEDKINDLMLDIDDYMGSDIQEVTSFLITELRSSLEEASLTAEDYDEANGIMSDFLDSIMSGDLPIKESFMDAVLSGRFIDTVYDPNTTDIPIDYFDNTTDKIFKDEAVEQSSIDSNFLQKYFGVNTGARLYAEQIWKEAFVNNILVDRKNGQYVTADDIDSNMRHYQEELFETVR